MARAAVTIRRTAARLWARTPERVREALRSSAVFDAVRQRVSFDDLVRFRPATGAVGPRPPHVLILDLDLPQPTRSGGHRRLLEVATLLRDSGVAVTIGSCNMLEQTAVAWDVPIATLREEALALEQRFPLIIGPDKVAAHLDTVGDRLSAVWFSRTGPGLLHLHNVLAAAPAARIVFDSMDAEHVRLARRAELANPGGTDLGDAGRKLLDSRRQETLMVEVADAVIAVSRSDADSLAALVGGAEGSVSVIPNLYDLDSRKPHGDRSRLGSGWDLLFVGGYLHEANTDAVRWLLDGIIPRLGPNRYRVALVGHGLPPDLVRQADGVGVSYLGEVSSLDDVYAMTRVSIAPVRFGSGLKGKVIEAALHGLPVVGTTVAWEGIDVVGGVSGLKADDEDAFAAAIESLLESNERRQAMVDESRQWLGDFAAAPYLDTLRRVVGVDHG